jgi:hypothetical protein
MPAFSAVAFRALVIVMPRLRALVPRQITDLDGVGEAADVIQALADKVIPAASHSS